MRELTFPDKAVVEKPVCVSSHEIDGKLLVRAGASTRLQIVVDQTSDLFLEIFLAAGACVNLTVLQRVPAGREAAFTGRFYLKRHADLEVLTFAAGGAGTARNDQEIFFEEEHGFCSLKGLSVLENTSQIFHRVWVHHQAPHCTSRQFFKNILADKSQSDLDSLVYVHRDAQKSDSRQLNRNLLLSDDAQAHTRPQLKIDTDDVSCTHGASVGQLQNEELFYLQSRGLSDREARYLLTYGFAKEVLEDLKDTALRGDLERVLAGQIQELVARC